MERVIVKKSGIYLNSNENDTDIIYKIRNLRSKRWFIRNGKKKFFMSKKDGKKEYLVICIPKFEKPFFKENDVVEVEQFGRISDSKTL